MKVFGRQFGLPLLVSELIKQSAQRRMYAFRVLYATCLFLFSLMFFYERLSVPSVSNSPFAIMGHGRYLFQSVLALQFMGIYAFMPAITCGVITYEKERNSLGLLFLTRLGPWTILFEKYFSRLVTMFTFLLLSLPLMGFVYSLGGITQADLWSGAWFLTIAVLQVGALALMCSCLFRTTVASFIATYIFGALLMFTLPVLHEFRLLDLEPAVDFLRDCGVSTSELFGNWNRAEMLSGMFFPPFYAVDNRGPREALPVFLCSIPTLASTFVCLLTARVFVVRRAFAPPRNLLLGLFKKLDGLFTQFNENRLTRGIVLVKDSGTLPKEAPVAWRETTKKSLGTVRYLVRIFVAIEFPVLFLCVLMALSNPDSGLEEATILLFALWKLVVLVISVTSASLISGERSHETLDVLLATPMTGRDIVKQKFRGVYRLMGVLSIPLLTIYFTEAIWKANFQSIAYGSYSYYGRFPFDWTWYLATSLLSIAVYFPLVAWLSFLIGMKVRTQAKAIFGSLAALVAWCLVPFLFVVLVAVLFRPGRNEGFMYLFLLSPMTIIPFNEFGEFHEFGSAWLPIGLNFSFYGACAYVLRRWCLDNADRLLGRSDASVIERQPSRSGFALQPTAEAVGQT